MRSRSLFVAAAAVSFISCNDLDPRSNRAGAPSSGADPGVEPVSAAVVNADRGPDGRGPLQTFTHVIARSDSDYIPGAASVSDGVYRYTIPIAVPEGAGGLAPSLALSYASRNDNGPLGVGWAIDGLSSVTRCAHNVADDGFAGPVDVGTNRAAVVNRYCLDGVKLVPVARAGTVVTFESERADFARVRAFYASSSAAEPDYFQVDLPDGRVRYYGASPGSSSTNNAVAWGVGGAPTWAWHLSTEHKPGRAIAYTYERDQGTIKLPFFDLTLDMFQSRYVSTIEYSNKKVRFVWESRPDLVSRAAYGYVLSVRKRLKRIEVYSPASSDTGASAGSGALSDTAAWQYVLEYQASDFTDRSELKAIRLYDRERLPLRKTSFTWNARQSDDEYLNPFQVSTYDLTHGSFRPALHRSSQLLVGDFNGDGTDDLLYTTIPSATGAPKLFLRLGSTTGLGSESDVTSSIYGTAASFSLKGSVVADLDGDGRSELLVDTFNGAAQNGAPYRAYRLASGSFVEIADGNLKTLLRALRGTRVSNSDNSWLDEGPNKPVPLMPLDVDGDGIMDLVGGASWPTAVIDGSSAAYKALGLRTFRALNRSSRYAIPCSPTTGANANTGGCNERQIFEPFALGDVDGDGVTNIVPVVAGGPLTSSTNFTLSMESGYAYTGDQMYSENIAKRLDDANGDGTADVLDFSDNYGKGLCGTGSIKFRVYTSTGIWPASVSDASFSHYDLPLDTHLYPKNACTENRLGLFMKSVRYGDFNGDGIRDILLLNPGVGGAHVSLDSGTTLKTNQVAYRVPPVLLLGSGTGYTQKTLPLGGARVRELTDACWAPAPGAPSFYRTNSQACIDRGIGQDFGWAQTGDFNGDGLTDLAQFVLSADAASLKLEVVSNKKPNRRDVILSVREGRFDNDDTAGYADSVSYADLPTMAKDNAYACTDPDVWPGGTNWKTVCAVKGMFLVRSYRPMGRPGGQPIRYGYRNALSDPRGREFLGFTVINALDPLMNTLDGTRRHYTCPALSIQGDFGAPPGAPAGTRTGRACFADSEEVTATRSPLPKTEAVVNTGILVGSPGLLRRTTTTTTYELVASVPNGTPYTATGTFHVRPKHVDVGEVYRTAVTSAYEAVATPDNARTADYLYDAYSNPTTVIRTTVLGITDRVKTTYDNLPNLGGDKWFIGLPRRVEHARIGAQTITRTVTHTYTTDGQVDTSEIEPGGSADLDLKVHYVYDNDILKPSRYNVLREELTGADRVTGQPRTRTRSFTYDADGINVATVTDAAGTTTFSYEPQLGALIAVVDRNGVGTDFVVDKLGKRWGTFPDAGQAVLLGRNFASDGPSPGTVATHSISTARLASLTPPVCPAGTFTVNGRCFTEAERTWADPMGRTTKVIRTQQDGLTYVSTTFYDGHGNPVFASQPKFTGNDEFTYGSYFYYDDLDRLYRLITPDQQSKTWQFPSWDRVDATDEAGTVTSSFIDRDGRALRTEENLKGRTVTGRKITTAHVYDPYDNPTDTTRTAGTVTRTVKRTFDLRGRMVTHTDDAKGLEETFYDAFGDVYRERDALGSRTITRDVLGRMTRNASDGDALDYETYEWDTAANGLGKLASATRMPDDVKQLFSYNELGQPTTTRLDLAAYGAPGSRRVVRASRNYDSEGRADKVYCPTATTTIFGTTYQHVYNGTGALERVVATSPALAAPLWRGSYDADNLFETFGDNSWSVTRRAPDTGRVSEVSAGQAGSAVALTYGYYPDGNVKTRNDSVSGVGEQMTYDSLGRLELWQRSSSGGSLNIAYAYDDLGAMKEAVTSSGFTPGGTVTRRDTYALGYTAGTRTIPDAVNAVTGDRKLDYDALGRRTSTRRPTTSTSYEYLAYNHWDLPTRIETRVGAAGAPPTSTTVRDEYRYDAFGTRAMHAKPDGADVTYYLGDLAEVRVNRTTGASQVLCHVAVSGRRVADVLQSSDDGQTSTTTVKYPHLDALGSTVLVTNPDGSATRGFYEPFGALLDASGNPGTGPGISQDFTGHERDGAFINMKGRFFDPALRRFVSPDPFVARPGRSQGYEAYGYVSNSPFRYTDPTGLRTCTEPRGGFKVCTEDDGSSVFEFDTDKLFSEPGRARGGVEAPSPPSGTSGPPNQKAPDGVETGSTPPGAGGGQPPTAPLAGPPPSGRRGPTTIDLPAPRAAPSPPPSLADYPCRDDGSHFMRYLRDYAQWQQQQADAMPKASPAPATTPAVETKRWLDALDAIEGSFTSLGVFYMGGTRDHVAGFNTPKDPPPNMPGAFPGAPGTSTDILGFGSFGEKPNVYDADRPSPYITPNGRGPRFESWQRLMIRSGIRTRVVP